MTVPRPVRPGFRVRRDDGNVGDDTFRRISDFALGEAGIALPASKRALVQSRMTKALRTSEASDAEELLDLASDPNNVSERQNLISVLTTNVTSFFRERHHFDHLAGHLLPAWASGTATARGVRIWSAGCSGGQEAYSIAIECLRTWPDAPGRGLLILATDIDPAMLDRARAGHYDLAELSGISDADRHRFFVPDQSTNGWRVASDVQSIVRFRELNLHAPWPMRRQFDAIFCRNVMIYFDAAHQATLCKRFLDVLHPGGTLFLGHSERIPAALSDEFRTVGVTIHRKPGPAAAADKVQLPPTVPEGP